MGKSYRVAMHLRSYGILVTEPGHAERWVPLKFATLAEAKDAIRLLLAHEMEAVIRKPAAAYMDDDDNRPRQEAEAVTA